MLKQDQIDSISRCVHAYRPRLLAYVKHFIDDNHDAEDIVQDSFLKYYSTYKDFTSPDFPRLIFKIIRNSCLDYIKHKKYVDQIFVNNDISVGELLYNYDFSCDDPEMDCFYSELKSQINSIMLVLPSRCREVFTLSRFEHKSNPEIAEMLGISVSTVEKHIVKALSVFRKQFSESSANSRSEISDALYLAFLLFILS